MTAHLLDKLTQARTRDVLLTDAGLETVLIFEHGVDLPAFAAFPLLDDQAGRDLLASYYAGYLRLAADCGTGFVLETPTWRASRDWGATLGFSPRDLHRINRDAVGFLRALPEQSHIPVLVSGCVGPRADGYARASHMSPAEAADYHRHQVGDFAAAGADLVTSFTFAYADEAAGFASAASAAGVPAVVGFTVETDGRLPSGQPLGPAIDQVDELTSGYPAWFMVNCAHPDHVAAALAPAARWAPRIGALRSNASRLSHAELDASDALDSGDPDELAAGYRALRTALSDLRVVGGCCGTSLRHITAIADACIGALTCPPPAPLGERPGAGTQAEHVAPRAHLVDGCGGHRQRGRVRPDRQDAGGEADPGGAQRHLGQHQGRVQSPAVRPASPAVGTRYASSRGPRAPRPAHGALAQLAE